MVDSASLVPAELIEKRIYVIRDQKVMLDSDLAKLYEVNTKVLVQAVKRNIDRFPKDFMFQINDKEFEILRSQIVTSNKGGRRYNPYVFTEPGVAMLSTVLKSKRAIHVNIEIIRTFIRLRQLAYSHKELSEQIEELEKKYDYQFKIVFDVIKQLMAPEKKKQNPIGFKASKN